jgi:hypothetical protein
MLNILKEMKEIKGFNPIFPLIEREGRITVLKIIYFSFNLKLIFSYLQ